MAAGETRPGPGPAQPGSAEAELPRPDPGGERAPGRGADHQRTAGRVLGIAHGPAARQVTRALDPCSAIRAAIARLAPLGTSQVHDLATSSMRSSEALRGNASARSLSQVAIRAAISSLSSITCPRRAVSW